jgi:hypothetical protein
MEATQPPVSVVSSFITAQLCVMKDPLGSVPCQAGNGPSQFSTRPNQQVAEGGSPMQWWTRDPRRDPGADLRLISEVGYAQVTFEAVAARAAVSRKCNLPAVALAGCSRLRRHNAVDGGRLPPPPNTGTLAGELRTFLTRVVRRFESP